MATDIAAVATNLVATPPPTVVTPPPVIAVALGRAIGVGFVMVTGYQFWSKIVQIAAKRIPFLESTTTHRILSLAGAMATLVTPSPVILLQSVALVVIAFREWKAKRALLEQTGGPMPYFLEDLGAKIKEAPERHYVGTDRYIREMEIILSRAEKPNVLLVGPGGVGKSVIVENLASRIVFERLPADSILKGKKILRLDVKEVLRGSSFFDGGIFVGTLETRIGDLVKYLKKQKNAIVFADEFHLLKGAGSSRSSQTDIAELLKEDLARAGISIIGATSTDKFNDILANDGPLMRRFEIIDVVQPDRSDCLAMIQGQKAYFAEKYPKTSLNDDAIQAAIFFSLRDFPKKTIPDAPMDLIHNAHSAAREAVRALREAEAVEIDVQRIAREHAKKRRQYSAERLVAQFAKLQEVVPQFFAAPEERQRIQDAAPRDWLPEAARAAARVSASSRRTIDRQSFLAGFHFARAGGELEL